MKKKWQCKNAILVKRRFLFEKEYVTHRSDRGNSKGKLVNSSNFFNSFNLLKRLELCVESYTSQRFVYYCFASAGEE